MTNKRQYPPESSQYSSPNNAGVYEIKIKGLLDDHWGQWFEGMTLKRQEDLETRQGCTLIIGLIADQPALHGLLAKVRDLNLTLISVRKLDSTDLFNQGGDEDDTNAEAFRQEST